MKIYAIHLILVMIKVLVNLMSNCLPGNLLQARVSSVLFFNLKDKKRIIVLSRVTLGKFESTFGDHQQNDFV